MIRTALGAVAIGAALCSAVPARADMPVIDITAIGKLLSEIQVLQQQYAALVNVYNSVAHLTSVTGLAPGLDTPLLQNPMPATSSIPGLMLGTTGATTLPYGSNYLAQFPNIPQGGDWLSTSMRNAANTLASLQAIATQNLSALEQRARQLPQLEAQIDAQPSIQDQAALKARIASEQAYVQNQQAQAADLQAMASTQTATLQQEQIEAVSRDESSGLAAICAALGASGTGAAAGACSQGGTPTPETAAPSSSVSLSAAEVPSLSATSAPMY